MNDSMNPEQQVESGFFGSIMDYFEYVSTTESYWVRFLHTLFMMQVLCMLLFIVIKGFVFFEKFEPILIIAFFFAVFGFCMIVNFIITAKAKAATYLLSSISYLGIAIFFKNQLGFVVDNFDIIKAGSFIGLFCLWNLLFSVAFFLIGGVRTFIIGVASDYKK